MRKRIMALLIMVTLILGSVQVLPIQHEVKAATESREYSLRDWGIASCNVLGTEKWYSKIPITSWDGVAIKEYVRFDVSSSNSYLCFGTPGKLTQGVAVRYDVSTRRVTLGGRGVSMNEGVVSSDVQIMPEEEFLLCITFTMLADGSLQVGMSVNGETPKIGTFSVNTVNTSLGCGILIRTESGDTISVRTVTEENLTFRDWGFLSENVSGATIRSKGSPIDSWNNVTVQGYVTFSATSQSYLTFGEKDNNWLGAAVRYDATKKQMFLGGRGVTMQEGTAYATPTIDANSEVFLSLSFEILEDGRLQIGMSVDNSIPVYGTFLEDTVNNSLGCGIYIYAVSGETISIRSTTEQKKVRNEIYNIEQTPYVLTSSDSVAVNGNDAVIGSKLTQAGDYVITTNQNGILTERTVSLYILGDADLSETTVEIDVDGNIINGIELNAADVITLEGFLTGTVATRAQKQAADLNNNGRIDQKDLELLKSIVEGSTDRQTVLQTYHVDALSFSYLGGEEVMPIVGYYGPNATHLTDEVFQDIKDSGVNIISYSPIQNMTNPTKVWESLKIAEKHGIGMFVNDALLNPLSYDEQKMVTTEPNTQLKTDSQVATLRGAYSCYDSYLGNYLVDEPIMPNMTTENIPVNSPRNYQFYTEIAKQLNNHANSLGYINLPAGVWFLDDRYNYMSTDVIAEYEAMVKTITEETNAKVLSFDRYMKDTETVKNCKRYMVNLDIIRNQAKDAGIPFWAFAQAGGNWKGLDESRIPTEAEFYWEVNTALAFGAKGIQYYPLVQTHYAATGDLTSDGLLNADYEPNVSGDRAWYTYAQNANNQIKAVDEVLMKAESLGVIATGDDAESNTKNFTIIDSSSTTGTTKKSIDSLISYADIKDAQGVQRVTNITTETTGLIFKTTQSALTGVFNYQGQVALYIVNWDTTAERDITVTFNETSNYRVVSADEDGTGVGEDYTCTLAPGGAVLLVIEDEVQKSTETTEYTEYTFDEWGLTDGHVDNTGKLSGTAPSEVTSWDKVAVSGYVAFTGGGSILFDTAGNTDGGVRILYYGGSVSIGGKGITMYSDATCGTSAGILTSGAIVAEGAEAYIRVELDVVATNVLKASLYVNDAEPVSGYYQLSSTNLKITMHGFATGDKVEWRSPEEISTEYAEYTFSNWGLTDGYVDNTGKLSGTAPSEVTSWDKVAVSGYAAFTGQGSILFDTIGNTDGGMRILYYGGSVSIGGKGITMYSDATCATSAGILTSGAIVAEGAEAYIRVELDVVATNVLKASLYVNDAEPVIGYYQLSSTNLKITMHGFVIGDKVEWSSGVKRYADMSVYRRTGEYQAPELPGYVFSGWETLEGNAVDADTKSGFAYAKFVDEDVLSVKAQLTAGTTAESTTTDMRLVTSVDNLSYQEIGFDVSTPYGSLSHSMNTVYKEIVAQEGGVEFSYTPAVFSNSSTYFATVSITRLFVQSNLDVNITVNPYWVTVDGTKVYGVTRALTLQEGIDRLNNN